MAKYIIILVAVLALSGGLFFAIQTKNKNQSDSRPAETAAEKNNLSEKTKLSPPSMTINKNKNYKALLKTSAGDIEIELNAQKTPSTVNNFVYLAKNNFYDNVIFHRIIKGFMIQGGDPKGDGTGGPGYRFKDEPFEGEYKRGIVAMANAGPNTNGSQFFIMHKDYPLPKNYVIFGKVANGMETVDKIAEAPVQLSATGEVSKPINSVVIESVKIIEE